MAYFVAILSCVVVVSCSCLKKNTENIPFVVAENYFIIAREKVPVEIKDQSTFDRHFERAAFKGKNGEPTKINFQKQWAIVIDQGESKTISDVRIKKLRREKGKIIAQYACVEDREKTYPTRAFVMVVVDKKYKGKVDIEKID